MAVLSSKQRKRLPASKFALPGKKMFPLTDRTHDIKAEQFAGRSERAGNITPAEAALVRAEAKRKLASMKGKK